MAKKTKAEIEAELAAAAAAAEAEAVAKAEAEVKERAEAEAAERKRKEVETQRRAEEVERIRQGHKDKVASEQAAATLLHQLSRVHCESRHGEGRGREGLNARRSPPHSNSTPLVQPRLLRGGSTV